MVPDVSKLRKRDFDGKVYTTNSCLTRMKKQPKKNNVIKVTWLLAYSTFPKYKLCSLIKSELIAAARLTFLLSHLMLRLYKYSFVCSGVCQLSIYTNQIGNKINKIWSNVEFLSSPKLRKVK